MYNLKKENYYTQRNNTRHPFSACMPTSRAMFYIGNGFIKDEPKNGEALDDYIFYLTEQVTEYQKVAISGQWAKKYPASQLHDIYPKLIDSMLLGKVVSKFGSLSIEKIDAFLESGKVLMCSGLFPTTQGHAVCIIGKDADGYILADPYGNYHTNYEDTAGYGVKIPDLDFLAFVHPSGQSSKLMHYPIL